jgi:hypothetical protein
MKHFVGVDVAMKETAICIVEDERRVVREGKAASEPEAIGTLEPRTCALISSASGASPRAAA